MTDELLQRIDWHERGERIINGRKGRGSVDGVGARLLIMHIDRDIRDRR